jgi:hypothetical protein
LIVTALFGILPDDNLFHFVDITSFLLLLAGGLLAGTMGSLLGLGGGIILVPFLTLVMGLPMHQAIATSITAVIATSTAGAAMNVQRGLVNIRLGMVLETATVAGAIAGGLTATLLSGTTLTRMFSILLVIMATFMAWRTRFHSGAPLGTKGVISSAFVDETTGQTVEYSVHRLPTAMVVSLFAGNVSGLLGVGGGIFKVPAMHLVCGMPLKAATATSNFMIGVTAAASAFIYFAHGYVNPAVTSSAILGVLAGSFLGVWLSTKIRTRVLSWIFIGVLLVVAIQLFSR